MKGEQLEFRDAWAASFKPQPMKPVLVEGLLLRGETSNIIASTKQREKLVRFAAVVSIASGRDFLGRRVAAGVFACYNELHSATLENRLFEIREPCSWVPEAVKHKFDYCPSAAAIGGTSARWGLSVQSTLQAGEVSLFVLDAKYRFFVNGLEENRNEDQAEFHNAIDRFAEEMDAAVVLVHHR
ncbi:MAG UNVERIFIED_CONTAM: helicase RepA family protein [Planctomycetaceae bacterium]